MPSTLLAAKPIDQRPPALPSVGLIDRLRASFEQHADLPALETEHTTLTYRQLDEHSARLAAALARAGVQAGQIVPLLMRRSAELVIAQVALLRLGAAYAPLDLTSPPARLQAMLDVLRPSLAVICADASACVRDGMRVIRADDIDALPCAGAPSPWHSSAPDSPAYVMFTSGTTGVPKGVLIPQSGIQRLVCGADFAELRPSSRWGFLSSAAFDASTLEVWAPLFNGGCCVVQDHPLPSLDQLADFLLTMRITDTWLTAALFNALVEDRPDAFAKLDQLLIGGERVSPHHARAVLEACPRLRLINGYGPTENTTFTLCHTITLDDVDNPAGIPIGRPIRGTFVRVGGLDHASDEGELLAGGDGVALGYLDDTSLSARKFVELDGRRWYRSGDLVRRGADGVFEFLGRVDRQVKIQGHRIELEEIELALLACPGVANGAVMVRGDAAESRHLVACFGRIDDAALTADEVAAFLAERLPPPAVPRVLLPIARLPFNINGKLDRGALMALVDAELDATPADSAAHDVDWRSDAERVLATIWQRCLPSAHVHRGASLLALGGTSLTALRVSAQVREQYHRDLTPVDVLRFPVLAEQARRIEQCTVFMPVDRFGADVEDQLPLTQGQQALLAASELDATACAYLVHVALHVDALPDSSVLRAAFETLAARHPALRITTAGGAAATHGRVHEHLPDGWWNEHPMLGEAPSDLAWPQDLLDTINRPIDLGRAGVMRVDLWPVAGDSCLLVWTVHHVSIDEASIDLCLAELHQILAGTSLRPVYGSPLGFASLEKAWSDHNAVNEWIGILTQALAGTQPPLSPAPGPGREVSLELPRGLPARLATACDAWGITPFAPLLTAFGLALQDVFGTPSRFVSTPFSRRIEPELIEPAGYLLDLCLVEAGARDGESVGQTLARVQQAAIALQRPSFLPRRALAEALASREPQVERQLNTFAFTWRIEPSRSIPFGPQRARVLRVPQQGARYGLTLHAAMVDGALRCSVEALEEAFAGGQVALLAAAFARRIDTLCGLPGGPPAARNDPATPAAAEGLLAILSVAWTAWVGTPSAMLSASTDFLRCGGNSLTVMRMCAQLRREHGLDIDAAAFLARATFGELCALAAASSQRGPRDCIVVGSADAPKAVVLIPGNGGQALGLYQLAVHLQRDLGDDHSVIVLDLEAMLRQSPPDRPLWFLRERMWQTVGELGSERISAFVGFSLGGLLGLHLAQRFGSSARPAVWLLDTYAPRTMAKSIWFRIERRIGRALSARILAASPPMTSAADTSTGEPTRDTGGGRPLWDTIQHELAHDPIDAPDIDVHLVQAQHSVHHVGLLWRRASNGFNPRRFGQFTVHHIDAMHLELPRSMALATAELVIAGVRCRNAEAANP